MQTILNNVSSVSGPVSAGSGITTTAIAIVERSSPGMLDWLNHNAAAIGVMFTALTFFVYLASTVLARWLDLKERRARARVAGFVSDPGK